MKKTNSQAANIKRLEDLRPMENNPNKHTERGSQMVETSIREVGFADSLTVDRDGVVLSGNQRLETLADIGMTDPIVVKSDGTRPIVHQRVDLKASDPRAKQLAILANRSQELNLEWDPETLTAMGVDLSKFWTEAESMTLLSELRPPADFAEKGEGIEIEHVCPKCGYRFSGGQVEMKKIEET